jgi:2-polyprenyl-3-methyl-5-hydroxy-6-metoxy-1,4-benzoquinol methylase
MNRAHNEREKDFHDRWAGETSLSEIKVFEAFENITAQENRFILSLMGDLRGLKLLDIGAGLGESSVYFALKGADVTANDVSPVMLERCLSLANIHGAKITTLLGSADEFDFGENRFDMVYGANVLHHCGDLHALLRAVKNALKPGGRFFFYDPLAYNPAIKVYRWMATEVRSDDERPLRFSLLKTFRRMFPEVRHREFWLLTLLIFFKYFLIDEVHPNSDRYWKRILTEDPQRIGWWFKPLLPLDRILLAIPPLNYLAWNIVIWGRK